VTINKKNPRGGRRLGEPRPGSGGRLSYSRFAGDQPEALTSTKKDTSKKGRWVIGAQEPAVCLKNGRNWKERKSSGSPGEE